MYYKITLLKNNSNTPLVINAVTQKSIVVVVLVVVVVVVTITHLLL